MVKGCVIAAVAAVIAGCRGLLRAVEASAGPPAPLNISHQTQMEQPTCPTAQHLLPTVWRAPSTRLGARNTASINLLSTPPKGLGGATLAGVAGVEAILTFFWPKNHCSPLLTPKNGFSCAKRGIFVKFSFALAYLCCMLLPKSASKGEN